jgi:hypothetical protein
MKKPFYIYVDVDETLIRNYGAKRIPMPNVIRHVQELKSQDAMIYCWSSGGAAYAKEIATELGIEECFEGFLPKPQVVIDDLALSNWRNLIEVHPNECDGKSISDYRGEMNESKEKS